MSSEAVARKGRPRAPFDGRSLARLARHAGGIALDHAASGSMEEGAARDVTHAIESWITHEASASRPRVRIALVRETGPLPKAEWVLTVDALDGMDAYLAGVPTWSISIGLLHRGDPWSAAICAPALNDWYVASSGGLRWQGRALSADSVVDPPTGFVLGTGLGKRSLLRMRRRREAEAPISYHACLVARGAAEGAILGRINLREAAPLVCLLTPVGAGLVSLRTGEPLDLATLRRGQPSRAPVLAVASGRAGSLVRRLNK